jgi:ribosome biogenesis protein ENP2
LGLQILSEDYSKAAFLCADRSVHLHARYGGHFRTRVPCFGRDLAYAPESADLLIAGSAPEIHRSVDLPLFTQSVPDRQLMASWMAYLVRLHAPLVCGGCLCRLNLSEGCFLTPLASQSPAVNACAVSPAHGLFAAAGEDGKLECFDLRQRRSAGVIHAAAAAGAVRSPFPPCFLPTAEALSHSQHAMNAP